MKKNLLSTLFAVGAVALVGAGCCEQSYLTDGVHPERTVEEYRYTVRRTDVKPELGSFLDASWNKAETGVIANFRFDDNMPTKFMPETKFRALYDDKGIYIIFRSHDRFVASHSDHHGDTWMDSCFEFFLQPPNTSFYWNFECNAAGKMMCTYRERTTPVKELIWFTDEDVAALDIHSTLNDFVLDAITEPTTCEVAFFIPFEILERQSNIKINPADLKDQVWRANFYHCGFDAFNGNPHWAAWAWVAEIDFHNPAEFGFLFFE